jgi:broad specificity phosphatase PhoE
VLEELPVEGSVPIVVTHGGAIPHLIGAWLKLGPEAMATIGFASHTASITTLVHDPTGLPAIERHNDVAHLSGLDGWASLAQFA